MNTKIYMNSFVDIIDQIERDPDLPDIIRLRQIYKIFRQILAQAADQNSIQFTSDFARLSYITNRYQLDKKFSSTAQRFRRSCEKEEFQPEYIGILIEIGLHTVRSLLYYIWNEGENPGKLSKEASTFFKYEKINQKGFRPLIEALVTEIDLQSHSVTFQEDECPEEIHVALFDQPDNNDAFNRNIQSLSQHFALPVHVNFIDCIIRDDGKYIPKAIIIQPDYLLDVTTVAEASSQPVELASLYVLRKYLLRDSYPALMIGNIANKFLDELISNPNLEFRDILVSLFHDDALQWAQYTDLEVKDIIAKIKLHFDNLKRVVNRDFKDQGIILENTYLEPSFYCRDYGLQGRLDLLCQSEINDQSVIVELKSGKTFKPNAYGINHSHYAQTLCYDMIIRSVYKGRRNPRNYILYSQLEGNNLKYAPEVKEQKYNILASRNDIVCIEQAFASDKGKISQLLEYLIPEDNVKLSSFAKNDLQEFYYIYTSLSPHEKDYFLEFSNFIAKEQMYSKIGGGVLDSRAGQAALWADSIEEKKERFSIFNDLVIKSNQADQADPIIVLQKTKFTSELANFRKGDIAVLYPSTGYKNDILHQQLFKCTVLEIGEQEVTVRLRSVQRNMQVFRMYDYWHLEEDSLDSGFCHMYQNLFEWACADEDKRDLLLGMRRPIVGKQDINWPMDEQLTAEQKNVILRIFQAQEYFLLWGPPGTGKTNLVLKNLVKLIHLYTSENILLLSYTNRAVDEICEAVTEAGFGEDFIRIGSRYSAMECFHKNLLDQKAKTCKNRQEILRMLDKTRIFVGTVSSMLGKRELFNFKKFDTVIIDEASQILEPMLMGLLTNFKKFILIGDHKQLPAVVRQKYDDCHFQSKRLIEQGFVNKANSLFERMYLQCLKNNWNSAFGILTQQGRMHEQLMHFPNQRFYEGLLKTIPGVNRLKQNFRYSTSVTENEALVKKRLIFIPTIPDHAANWKTNRYEASKVIMLLHKLRDMHSENNMDFTAECVGVITPFRAQIALIRSMIGESFKDISIDTVERYQGGARDIIILSMVANSVQLGVVMTSVSAEGIDRKLNVALTRAREQIIIIGNEEILRKNRDYNELLDLCYRWEI